MFIDTNDIATFEDKDDDEVFSHFETLSPTPTSLQKTIIFNETLDNYSDYLGERIDKIATLLLDGFSREQIKDWLGNGSLTINGESQKPKYRIKADDRLELTATLQEQQGDIAENIPLDIVYEDDSLVIINKPDGMVVHPGAGNPTGTLVNALLYHYPQNRLLPRAGLVHRIDKHTTGLLVVAKDTQSQLHLIGQLKQKSVYRHYQAIVLATANDLSKHRTIDAPIARHSSQRTKMAVVSAGKNAVTHIDNITPINEQLCLVNLRLETGRTHQIRVHLSHLGFPLLGDSVYGSPRKMAILLTQLNQLQQALVQHFNRQALHAYELGLIHPKTGKKIQVQAPLPKDMQTLMAVLQTK